MKIYKFEISYGGLDDSFYFRNPPTRIDVRKALRNNQKRAGESFKDWYSEILPFVERIAWVDLSKGNLVQTGGKISGTEATYGFSRHELIEN